MFQETLNDISRRIGGTRALSLVARDGIQVESIQSDPEIDLEILTAELMSQVRNISDDQRELNVGPVQHLTVITEALTLMISAVAADYYLLLVLGENGNFGRARFELRRARLILEDDLI